MIGRWCFGCDDENGSCLSLQLSGIFIDDTGTGSMKILCQISGEHSKKKKNV